MSNLYNKDSIESLDPREFTRLRPDVYCGDTTYATQLLIEILSNSIDEYRLGHGSSIDIIIDEDIVSVRDYGQGFLINEKREDGKTVLEAAFSVLNTSGKYREDGTYEGTSLGAFGIGSKLTNYLSNWLSVTTFRDGKSECIDFKEGLFENRKIESINAPSGTIVTWKPSKEFFTNTEVEIEVIKNLLKTTVCLCPGLKIDLIHNKNKESFYSEDGLNDLINYNLGKKQEILEKRFYINESKDKNKIDFIMTYTDSYNSNIVSYVNTGATEKGPHISQIKTLLTREFNKFFKNKGWLKKDEDNLKGEDIQEGIVVVFNLTSTNVKYDAQVKSTITQIDMSYFNSVLADRLADWFNYNEKDVKIIFDKAVSAKRARDAAKKAKDLARKPKEKKSKIANLPTKLTDCSNNGPDAEIYICEGDSAASPLIAARTPETQAIFPIRGKMINSFKSNEDKVLGNQEIANIIKALGLNVDSNGKLIYDKNKLRYGKIIAACDGK